MEKDFDKWNKSKKFINKDEDRDSKPKSVRRTTGKIEEGGFWLETLKLVCPRLRGGEAEAIYAN